MAIDPLAGKYPSYSPYNYTLNNPINNFDPDGRRPWTTKERANVLKAMRVAEERYYTERGADRGRAIMGRQINEGWRYYEPGVDVDVKLYENMEGLEKAEVSKIIAKEELKATLSRGIFGDPEPNILNDTDPATGSEISYTIKEGTGNIIRFITTNQGGNNNVIIKYYGVNEDGQYYELGYKDMSAKEFKKWQNEMLKKAKQAEEQEKKKDEN